MKRDGKRAEQKAADFLEAEGMRILQKNYRCRQGEVDLIGQDGSYLVFIEVKARNSNTCGVGSEAVTVSKQRKICRTAAYYCYEKKIELEQPIRFDVVELYQNQIHHIKNAFDYVG